MHSLVPFPTAMGRSRSRLSIESVKVLPGCVCKGGSDLTVISFPRFELDSWYFIFYVFFFFNGITFSLEYTLGNSGKLRRVTLVGIGDDTS